MSDSKYPTDEPLDPRESGQASDRVDPSAGDGAPDHADSHPYSIASDADGRSDDDFPQRNINPEDEFRQPIEMYPRRKETEPEASTTPIPSDGNEDDAKDVTVTPLSKDEFAFEHRPHIRKTGDPLYVDPDEAFDNVSGLSVDDAEDDPIPARRRRFRPPSDGRRFGGGATAGKTRATTRPAMTLVSNKTSPARSATESSIARDRLKADEIQHEKERTRADIVALKLQDKHFGLGKRLADAGMVRGPQPPEAPPSAKESVDDVLSDFESPVPSVGHGQSQVVEPASESVFQQPADNDADDEWSEDHWNEEPIQPEPEPSAPRIPDSVPAAPSYPLPNFRPGASAGSVSPIHGSAMRGDIRVDFSKGGIRFGTDGGEPVERIGFDEPAAPVADVEPEFVPPEQAPLPPMSDMDADVVHPNDADEISDVGRVETNAGFYPPAAAVAPAHAPAGQADIDQQFAYFEQTAAQEHGADYDSERYIDHDDGEFHEELDLEGEDYDVDDDRRGIAQKSVFEIDAPPDSEPLRVEPTTPASFKTMRNLVSERVHRHARKRRSDEQELERQVSGYRLKRSVRRGALGLTVAISLIIGVAFLALDEPNVSREPSIRDILKDLPPMNPSESGGIAQTEAESPEPQRNSTVIIEPDAVDNRAGAEPAVEPVADNTEQAAIAVAEQAVEAEPQGEPNQTVSAQLIEAAESAPDAATDSSPIVVEDNVLPPTSERAGAEQPKQEAFATTDSVETSAIDDEVLAGTAVPPAGSEPNTGKQSDASTQQPAVAANSTETRPANGIEITTTTLTPAAPASTPDPITEDAADSTTAANNAEQPRAGEQVAAVMLPGSDVDEGRGTQNTTASPSDASADTDEGLQNSIDARMDVAWDQIASLRLTTPVGDNAFETLSNVLDSDPKNEEALLALSEIRDRYLEWAERAVDEGELAKAITNYEKVIIVNPDDDGSIAPVIAQLRKQIEAVELTAAVNERAAPQYNPQQDQQREPVVVSAVESSRMSRARDQLAEMDIEVTIRNLVELTNEGDYEAVKLLLESGLSVDSRAGQYGFSPLIVTAIRGDTGMLKLLLDNNVDIDGRSSDGRTALMAAAWNGHQFIVDTLLNNKASVQIANADGWTALHYAAWQGHLDIVKTLLDNGADPNVRNDDGWTVAETAEKKGFIQILEIIESRGQG